MNPATATPPMSNCDPRGFRLLRTGLVTLGLLGPMLIGTQAKAVEMINAGASVSVVSAGQAITCTINVFNSNNNCAPFAPGDVFGVLGDKKLSFVDFSIDNPGNAGVTLTYRWLNGGDVGTFGDDAWEFNVAATPFVGGPLSVTYTYDVEIVDGGYYSCPMGLPCFKPGVPGNVAEWIDNTPGTSDPWFFKDVTLESDVASNFSPPVIVTKDITPPGVTLTSTNGGPGPQTYTFLNNYKTIRITDTITLPASTDISSVTNRWTQKASAVPGPLPILGAGVAFGMSRNLRRRIKASATI